MLERDKIGVFREHPTVSLLHLLARRRSTPLLLLKRFDERFGQLLTLAHAISASISAGMSPQLFFCWSWASLVVSHSSRVVLSFWNFWDRDKAFSRSCLPSVTCKEKENKAVLNWSNKYWILYYNTTWAAFRTWELIYLCSQVIVEKFESSELFVHGLGVLRLLFLHNLSTSLYHRLHLQLHLTQQLVQFL